MLSVYISGVIALTIEAASTFETQVIFYETTQRNIPKNGHLHTCRREKLKSHYIIVYTFVNKFYVQVGTC
jgi:hypothetical protein